MNRLQLTQKYAYIKATIYKQAEHTVKEEYKKCRVSNNWTLSRRYAYAQLIYNSMTKHTYSLEQQKNSLFSIST